MSTSLLTKSSFSGLSAATAQAVTAGLQGLLEGEASDLQAYAAQIVNDTLFAAATGDADSLQQLADQRQVLLEASRLRAVEGAYATVSRVLDAALAVAIKMVVPL